MKTTRAGFGTNAVKTSIVGRVSAPWILPLFLLALPSVAQTQFNYTTNNGTVTITGYTGSGGSVSIPATINDLPVISIGDDAFYLCFSLTSVTIPDSVTSIGVSPFYGCSGLTNITVPGGLTSIGN